MSGYGMPSFDPSVGEADAYEAGPGGDLVAELFDEIDGAGRIAAGDGLVEQLWVNAGTQTQLLGVARDSLVRAEDAHDAAQAAYAAVRAATGPLDASSVPGRRSGFTSSYGDLRRMLGKRPMDVQGVSRSKDWAQVERDAERLIAAAMGLPNASEGKPHEEGSAERRGPRVSADAFHDGAGSQPAETTAGEVAMSAWVVLWVGGGGELRGGRGDHGGVLSGGAAVERASSVD